MLDLLIRGGTVVDGTGAAPFRADVAVATGRIVDVGVLPGSAARAIIDVTGLTVTPGFIDMHSHDDVEVISNPLVEAKTRQGVTTDVVGHCGLGPAPYRGDPAWRGYLRAVLGPGPDEWDWRSFSNLLDRTEAARPAPNVVTFVSYGAIRNAVMGMEQRYPTPMEHAAMRNLVREAMVEGAAGMSVGLVYVPGVFATRDELVDLFRIVGEADRLMDIHLRSQGNMLLESAWEALDIADAAKVKLHISHLCALGQPNWHKVEQLLELVDQGRRRGIDITFDQHPYSAASTMLNQILPPWANAGGPTAVTARLRDPEARLQVKEEVLGLREPEDVRGWERRAMFMDWEDILIADAQTPGLAGKNVAEIAEEQRLEPIDAVIDLLANDGGQVGAVYKNLYQEAGIAAIMKHPQHMVGSDGIFSPGVPHPRLYGSFARVLGKYGRQERVLDLATAVQRMTAAPASRLGLKDRGTLRPGKLADIVVFDSQSVIDTGTYTEPRQYPAGISHVVVAGIPVVRDGRMTGERPGRVLRAG